jgi:aspartyl-tRNA(Asn)/glutamyl-tRNA(Gln) amidotransferase subunit A
MEMKPAFREATAGHEDQMYKMAKMMLSLPDTSMTDFIDGQTVDATYLQGATVPLNVTGLPGISMRFGTSKEGLPINVQVVGSWLAESTILHVASLLESVSPVRYLHPTL